MSSPKLIKFYRLRHQGAGYGPRQEEPKWLPAKALPAETPEAPLKGSALDRQLKEMQVSLTLTGLQRDRNEGLEQLTSTLLVRLSSSQL